jgi:hypothetical protein
VQPATLQVRLSAVFPRGHPRAQEERERRVKEAGALLQVTVERLSRSCPPELIGKAARDDLLDLKPCLEGALAALEDIERHRNLNDGELAQRRAFRMVLVATR